MYGSLRPMGGSFERLLGDAAVAVRDASLAGHALYGWGLPYPFASPHPSRSVVGSIIEIDPEALDTVLEGLDRHEGSEYVRVERSVEVDGQDRTAFVYLASPAVELSDDHLVESGDWLMPF